MEVQLEDIPIPITNELEKRIADAFLIFDHNANKTADVREIGTIIRFLGCVPTEAEINEIISATEFEESNGIVHLSKFLPHVVQLLSERNLPLLFPNFDRKEKIKAMEVQLEDIPAPITNEFEQMIADAFLIFDHNQQKTADIREIGTIVRFMGCVPSDAEINEIIAATEMEEPHKGIVHLSTFLPHLVQLLTDHKMEPAPPEKLLEAFNILDPEGKGFVSKEYLSKVMMEEGEPFTQEELDEMMAVAVEGQTNKVPYEYYLNQLMYEPKDSIYNHIPIPEPVETPDPDSIFTKF